MDYSCNDNKDFNQGVWLCKYIYKKIHNRVVNNCIYYIDESVLLGTKLLVDSIRHFIRDPSGVFSICHLCECHIVQWHQVCLLNCTYPLVYHRNIFGSSSEVFGNIRQSSDIFGNFRKFSENVRERSSAIRNNFGKSSEIFGRWSETFGKSSKTPSSACLYNKKNITRRLEDMNFICSWQKQYFTHSLRSFVKYCFATRK